MIASFILKDLHRPLIVLSLEANLCGKWIHLYGTFLVLPTT